MANRETTFDLFRYQILPKSSYQVSLFDEAPISVEELKARKNELFESVLLSERNEYFHSSGEQLRFRLIGVRDTAIAFKLGKRKEIVLANENFEEESHLDYPSVVVVLDNHPDSQKLAISRENEAFSDSFVAARVLETNLTRLCRPFNLEVVINPILDVNDFWELVSRYEGRITQVQFNLIRPNLANISGTFREELRELTDSTNSLRTKVELTAPTNGTLENISPENERVNSLVNYGVQGGTQHIHIRAKGVRRIVKTEKTIVTTTIKDLEISGDSQQVLNAYNHILDEG